MSYRPRYQPTEFEVHRAEAIKDRTYNLLFELMDLEPDRAMRDIGVFLDGLLRNRHDRAVVCKLFLWHVERRLYDLGE